MKTGEKMKFFYVAALLMVATVHSEQFKLPEKLMKTGETMKFIPNAAVVHMVATGSSTEQCRTMKLYSNGYQYKQANVATTNKVNSISLLEKKSKSACTPGTSYGHFGTDVWVNKGCRGIFKVCYDIGEQCKSMKLYSNGYQYKQANVAGASKVNSISLLQKKSKSACTPGTSYGHLGTDVWVDRGCRGLFSVCYYTGRTVVVSCDSKDYKRNGCNIGTNSKVESVIPLSQQSSSPCILDFSYGVNGNMLWVDKGCGATFRVGVT